MLECSDERMLRVFNGNLEEEGKVQDKKEE